MKQEEEADTRIIVKSSMKSAKIKRGYEAKKPQKRPN